MGRRRKGKKKDCHKMDELQWLEIGSMGICTSWRDVWVGMIGKLPHQGQDHYVVVTSVDPSKNTLRAIHYAMEGENRVTIQEDDFAVNIESGELWGQFCPRV